MSVNSIFELDEFKGLQQPFADRQRKLRQRYSYYTGKVYSTARAGLGWLMPKVYSGIKPLYLPLSRAVHVDAGIIPGDWQLSEDYREALDDQVDQLDKWSAWDRLGVLYIHYGAAYGVSGLKIADLQDEKKAIVQPLQPDLFMLIGDSPYKDGADMGLIVDQRIDKQGRFEYAEVITPDQIMTFRNGTLTSFDGRDAIAENTQGRVPIIETLHMETGDTLGECTFQSAMPMLDEVNELASYLADIVKKHSEPQWAIFGAEASDLIHSGDNAWFFPGGSDAKILIPSVDIEGVLSFIKEISAQVKGSLPELAFDELKSKDKIATATLELQLMELVLKIKRSRPNYDHGRAKALVWQAEAAAAMGNKDMLPIVEAVDLIDAKRPVLPLDKETEISIEMQEIALEAERRASDNSEGLV